MTNCPFKKTLDTVITEHKCGIMYWNNLVEFNTKRVLYISNCDNLNNTNNIRGKHINIDCNEILILIQGNIDIILEHDTLIYKYKCSKNDYVYIPKDYYLEIIINTPDTIYIVLCDTVR